MEQESIELQQALTSLRYMGEEIHKRRIKLKKTLKNISFTTGLSMEDIQKIEQGEDTGNAADIWVVCEVLGIDYTNLLKEAIDYGKQNYNKEKTKLQIIKGGLHD